MTTLTDRYVHAATRTVHDRQRAELDRELRERIGDAVDARLAAGDGLTPADAEVAALTELGDPERLAARYVDRPLYLIGPRLYLDWLRLVKLLLAIAVPITTGVVIFAGLIGGGTVGDAVVNGLATGFSLAVNLAFWVTVVFAIIERTPARSTALTTWTPARLPELPKSRQVSRVDLILSIVFLVVAIGALVWQQFTVDRPGGEFTPILDPALWAFWLPYLIAVLVAEIVFTALLYRNRHWNWWFAAVNIVLNAAFAIPVVWLASTGQLFNPELFDRVGPDADGVRTVLTNLVIGAAVIIAIWDSVDGFVKAWRAQRDEVPAAGA
ncbi:hypothetical protein EDM22_13985 [Agromyces tardus]|uniref:Uncharacterized protein n=1 Tax=Agromyces tardus TaxID=2583849 RepID=A0A3M8A726_9MICO|nr:permease prefix domain 1-containing protein [Agromyces tardus]RNB46467.1 hypothetical protein EDM22_13985 [Agromyces tardus]